MFDYTIETVWFRLRETIKEAIARRVFDQMIEIAFFLVAKRFAVADEKLKITRVWLIDVRVVNLVEDSMTQREPETATCVVGRADAFFCAGSPPWLDPRRTKGHCILRRIHLLRAQIFLNRPFRIFYNHEWTRIRQKNRTAHESHELTRMIFLLLKFLFRVHSRDSQASLLCLWICLSASSAVVCFRFSCLFVVHPGCRLSAFNRRRQCVLPLQRRIS